MRRVRRPAPPRHRVVDRVRLDRPTSGGARPRLQDAARILEHSPARLEHARALVNLGTGLHARGRREEAREPLSQGLDVAHRCGAAALAEQARTELVAPRGATSAPNVDWAGCFTPAELRAARMAAEGLSNRQIAQALFLTTKTVEGQLSHAYAKLQVRGRGELAVPPGRQNPGVARSKVRGDPRSRFG